MCFAPTIQHCSLPVRRPQPFVPPPISPPTTAPVDVVPTRVTCPRINTATDRRPNTIQPAKPASQPATPAPPTFYATHPLTPFSRVLIPILGSQHRATPYFLPLCSSATYPSLPILLRVSLPVTLTLTIRRLTVALDLLVPLPFLFLLSSPFVLLLVRACPSHSLSFSLFTSLSLSFSLNMLQGLAVSFGLVCRLGQPPLLAKRSSKTEPGRHKKRMRRRERRESDE